MLEGRGAHTATLLPNGQVLVAGGRTNVVDAIASAELYDPLASATSVPAAPSDLTATVLGPTTVQVSWTQTPDPAAAGTVIADATGHPIATTASGQTSYTLQALAPGSYPASAPPLTGRAPPAGVLGPA
jgi:hypothetical protein